MPPVSRILEVAVYSLLNFLPFLALALYPFRNSLRFSAKVTGCRIGLLTVIQRMLGVWAAFFPGGNVGRISFVSSLLYAEKEPSGFEWRYLWLIPATFYVMW